MSIKHPIAVFPALGLSQAQVLESDWIGTPPAIFAHRAHTWPLDCSSCHPAM